MSWNLFDPAGTFTGMMISFLIPVVIFFYPNPDSDQRLFLRTSLMGVYVASFLLVSSLWSWLVVLLIVGMFLYGCVLIFREVRPVLPALLPESVRVWVRWAWSRYAWVALGVVLSLLFDSLFHVGQVDGLGFHISAGVSAFMFLSFLVTWRASSSVLFSFWGPLFALVALSFGPSLFGFPIAYMLTRFCQGDRRAAAVILLPILLVGLIYA